MKIEAIFGGILLSVIVGVAVFFTTSVELLPDFFSYRITPEDGSDLIEFLQGFVAAVSSAALSLAYLKINRQHLAFAGKVFLYLFPIATGIAVSIFYPEIRAALGLPQ